MTKRAIALAGGGPAAGLHIGALKRLNKAGITFDVWALSCIGAWVGIIYNQFDKDKNLEKTTEFFRSRVFRDDKSYSRFPINSVFGPDLLGNWKALNKYIFSPKSYFDNLVLPEAMAEALKETISFLRDSNKWNQGDFNQLVLELWAANPAVRYFTSMMYLSEIDGLTRIYYPKSTFLKELDFRELRKRKKPFMYHNAWNLTKKRLEQFANRPKEIVTRRSKDYEYYKYRRLTAQSLCACSALPFIEQTVEMRGDTYCEGALIDTVNFKRLLDDHPDLDEIWVSRIVDEDQIRPPKNLHDALANLCQLFAATVGEDDVKLFRLHAEKRGWEGKIREIKVSSKINFDWTHSNFDESVRLGDKAAKKLLKKIAAEDNNQTT